MVGGRESEELKGQLDVWMELMKERGLRNTVSKEKVRFGDWKKLKVGEAVNDEWESLKLVEQFIYLGTVLSSI